MDTNKSSGTDSGKPQGGSTQSQGVQQPSAPPTQPESQSDLQRVEKEMGVFERATLRWSRVAVIVSVATGIFVGVQAYFMSRQLDEMIGGGGQTERLLILTTGQLRIAADQARLMRQEWESTRAAFVNLDVRVFGRTFVMAASNTGGVTANNVFLKAWVSRITLPDRKVIGNTEFFQIHRQPLKKGESLPGGDHSVPIAWYDPVDFEAKLNQLEQTIKIEWEGGYDNGFGVNVHRPKTCFYFLVSNFTYDRNRPTIYPIARDLVPCEDFNARYAESVKSRASAEEKSKNQ